MNLFEIFCEHKKRKRIEVNYIPNQASESSLNNFHKTILHNYDNDAIKINKPKIKSKKQQIIK